MKHYKNQSQLLEAEILALTNKRNIKRTALKSQLDITYQELRPSKLLNRILNDVREEPEVKINILESIVSLVGGYLSKKIILGNSNSTVKNLLGYGVQYFATKIISKNIKH